VGRIIDMGFGVILLAGVPICGKKSWALSINGHASG
jgi:hypothetical protein